MSKIFKFSKKNDKYFRIRRVDITTMLIAYPRIPSLALKRKEIMFLLLLQSPRIDLDVLQSWILEGSHNLHSGKLSRIPFINIMISIYKNKFCLLPEYILRFHKLSGSQPVQSSDNRIDEWPMCLCILHSISSIQELSNLHRFSAKQVIWTPWIPNLPAC